MSDTHAWNGDERRDDPFAPGVVEDAIARSLRPDAPATPTTVLVRTLADAYALPPEADAVLARSRATLARRAEALNVGAPMTGGQQMHSTDSRQASATSPVRPPQLPRRQPSPFGMAWRTVAAVFVVALLGAGFFALLRGMQRPGGHPTPTATPSPASATATSGASTPTTIPPQPPAPAGVYVTAPGTLFLLNPSTGAIQKRYPFTWSSQGFPGTPLVVANGMVYFTYQSTVSTSSESDVVALSATSGALLWRTQAAGQLMQLTEADGVLYGGTENGSDTFYALRASDGSVLWTYHTPTLRPPAVVVGGMVYLMDQPANPTAQHVHALRASDGAQLWDTPLPQGCASADHAVVDAGMVFVACHMPFDMGQGGNGSVYGLRASDGKVLWHYTTNGEPTTGLAAGSGLVYVCPGGKNAAGVNVTGLYALDESSGAVRWQVANGDGSPEFDGGTVYAGVGSSLAAFSPSRGTVLWTYSVANQRIELGAPVIAGGVVYDVLNEQVVAISAANGAVLWRSPTLVSQQQGADGLSVVTGG
jgi:outer membrane protein assembly factor BamB